MRLFFTSSQSLQPKYRSLPNSMATSIARPALLPSHALIVDRASYCRYGPNTAGVQPRQLPAICASAALEAPSQVLLQGQRDSSKSSRDAERIVAHFSPLACSCHSCRLLLMPHLGMTRVAARLTPQPAPVLASGLVRRKPGRPKGSKNKKQSLATPQAEPEKVPVVTIDPATNTRTEKLEGSSFVLHCSCGESRILRRLSFLFSLLL
jgi:hypothetical protein